MRSQFGCLRKLGSFVFWISFSVFFPFQNHASEWQALFCSCLYCLYFGLLLTCCCFFFFILNWEKLFFSGVQYRTVTYQLIYRVKRTHRFTSLYHIWHCHQCFNLISWTYLLNCPIYLFIMWKLNKNQQRYMSYVLSASHRMSSLIKCVPLRQS